MERKIITDFSVSLAKEISERKIYDLPEISSLIKARINFAIRDIMSEYGTQAESEYLKLLDQQSKNKVGSIQYIQLGYKLSAAKQRKAAANRAANSMGREDDYQRLKNFIISKFGKEALDEFFNNNADEMPDKLPIYRT